MISWEGIQLTHRGLTFAKRRDASGTERRKGNPKADTGTFIDLVLRRLKCFFLIASVLMMNYEVIIRSNYVLS